MSTAKPYFENYSLAEVAGMIADGILEERMLSKESIKSKILSYARAFLAIKSDPNKKPNSRQTDKRVLAFNKADYERRFWLGLVRKMVLDHEMPGHYEQLNKELRENGLDPRDNNFT